LSCLPKKNYLEPCSSTIECSQLQGLYCSSNGTCNCLYIAYFDTAALNCLPKRNETEACNLNQQCFGDMMCLSGSCRCSNTLTQYFDSIQLICTNKTLKGISCTRNMTCRSDLGLSCENDTCECDSRTSYWSSIQTICVDCPSGWTIYQDKCYFVYSNLSTWDDAQSMCKSHGSNLVSMRTQADFDMVSGYYIQYTNYANPKKKKTQ
jgi:hypothetical protein